jgi:hypothetical protein
VIADEAWPKPPDITRTADLRDDQLAAIADRLRASWPDR